MKRNILLINLPGKSIRKVEENCGLALLKSYLDSMNEHADILDAFALRYSIAQTKEIIMKWLENNKHIEHSVGIAPYVTGFEELIEIGSFIKEVDDSCNIYLGGHFASLNKEYLIEHYRWIDGIVVGEGELTLHELMTKDYRQNNIAGFYCDKFRNEFNQRARIKNLDILPFQTRYLTPGQLNGQPFSITTSRGCYGQCSFCSISEFYRTNSPTLKQTYRSAESVSTELHDLVKRYSIKAVKIVDDNFFRDASNTFLEELVDLLQDLNLSFRLSARPNDITPRRAYLLHKLGAAILGIGVESADEEALQIYKKGIKLQSSLNALNYLKEYGISCLVNFIMFNPTITLEGLKKNVEFVKSHRDNTIYHRINSHLWIRATDPIAKYLNQIKLCKMEGFPYLKCDYRHQVITDIRRLFDIWCNSNMERYYSYDDVLMANGIKTNEDIYKKYNDLLDKDLYVMERLIQFAEDDTLKKYGDCFVNNCVKKWS